MDNINNTFDKYNKNIHMISITLTDTSEYVITGRNEDLSSFYIRSKSDFEKEMKNGSLVVSFATEGCYSESDIINMMSKSKFYTYFNNSYTDVILVNGNIKSIPNGTTKDNLKELSICCK